MFKGLGNIAQMMRQAQQMGAKMNEANDELKSKRVTATSGGGMVEVEANGLSEILRVKIDPTLIETGDAEMIEELLPAAINLAYQKAKQLHLESMKEVTNGMPGLDEAMSQLTGMDPEGKSE